MCCAYFCLCMCKGHINEQQRAEATDPYNWQTQSAWKRWGRDYWTLQLRLTRPVFHQNSLQVKLDHYLPPAVRKHITQKRPQGFPVCRGSWPCTHYCRIWGVNRAHGLFPLQESPSVDHNSCGLSRLTSTFLGIMLMLNRHVAFCDDLSCKNNICDLHFEEEVDKRKRDENKWEMLDDPFDVWQHLRLCLSRRVSLPPTVQG